MMTYPERDYKRGIRKAGAVASIIAAGAANAQNLWVLSAGRTAKLRGLHIYNGQPAPVQVTIGTAIPLVAAMAPFTCVNGFELILTERDLQEVEFSATITVMASAAGAAPANVQVQATVEEFQGPTG